MSAKLKYSHVCDFAMVDHSTKKASAINIFSQINAKTLPVTIPNFTFICEVTDADSTNSVIELSLVDEQGKAIGESRELTMGDLVDDNDFGILYTFTGIKFEKAGNYYIKLKSGSIEVGSHMFIVSVT